MAGNSTESGRSVTSKITSILMTFTEGSEHCLTEIARLAGLPISTAHRLTAELTSWRLLERTPDGLYRAGLPLRMMAGCPDRTPTLQERAPCVLEDLAAATLPAHPTALGRALLAFSPPGVVDMTIMRGLRPYTAHTVTSPDRFRRALAVTRLTRVAVTRFELEAGACGVAVPVFGPGGNAAAALELTVRDLGASLQSMLAVLTIAARSLTRELAGDRQQPGAGAAVSTPAPTLAVSAGI